MDGPTVATMNGSTVAAVIGDTCDHGACSALPAVVAGLGAAELSFCEHHWREAEERMVRLPSFLGVLPWMRCA